MVGLVIMSEAFKQEEEKAMGFSDA